MLSFEQRTSNVLFVVASTREKENWVIFCVMCQGHIRVPVPLGESMQQLQPAAFLRAFVPKDGILSLTDRNGRKHAATTCFHQNKEPSAQLAQSLFLCDPPNQHFYGCDVRGGGYFN
jgi:hypothetical protein